MNSTTKICHVNLATGFSGGEQQALTLIKQQIDMGYDISVVCNPKSPLFHKVQTLGCHTYACKQFLTTHQARITQSVDMVHVHEGRAVYWALIQHLMTKAPYLVTRRIDNPLKDKFLLNMAYRKAAHIVGVSGAISIEISKQHPSINAKVIPDSPVSYTREPPGIDAIQKQFPNKFIVIQAAKLYSHKGFDVTINSAKLLERSHPDIHICLLGDGPEEQPLKQLAGDISNVSFMGRQSNMGDWFAAADVLVHPSYTEGLGSVILEASNAGLPVIGSKAGGIPDAISNEENGLLVEIGSSKSLAEAILRIKNDKALRATIKVRAPQIMKQFKISHTAKQYQTLYLSP
mgnify:CR=1 FL=1